MSKSQQNGARAKILVVDGEPGNALTLSAILEPMGYDTATAFSGEQAATTALSFIPDLLLSEVCLHGISGIDAASQITAFLPDCKVLFLSGIASASFVLNTAPANLIYSYARKPIHSLDLLNSIAYLLSVKNSIHDSISKSTDNSPVELSAMATVLASAGFLTSDARKSGAAPNRLGPSATFMTALLQFGLSSETPIS
jgi:CheY-like chemotaxis protein